MLIDCIYLLTGIFAVIISCRYEYGILNYSFILNYSAILILGIELIRVASFNLANIDFYNNVDKIAAFLLVAIAYDSIVVFMQKKLLGVLIEKISLISLIYGFAYFIMSKKIDEFNIIMLCLNIVLMGVARLKYRNPFYYGVIHYYYCYLVCISYTISLLFVVASQQGILVGSYYVIFVIVAFNYHFQLNVMYNLSYWRYSPYIKAGWFARLILIIDYCEIPGLKL